MKNILFILFGCFIVLYKSQIIDNSLKGCYKNLNKEQWYFGMTLCFDGKGKVDVLDEFARHKGYYFTKKDTIFIYGGKAYSFLIKGDSLVSRAYSNKILTKIDTIYESPEIEENIRISKAKLLNEYDDLQNNGKADLKWYVSGKIKDSIYCQKIKNLCFKGLEVACLENLKFMIVNDFGGISNYFRNTPLQTPKNPNPEIIKFADRIKEMGDINVYNDMADYYININHKELAILELNNAYLKGDNSSTPTLNMLEAEEYKKSKKQKKK